MIRPGSGTVLGLLLLGVALGSAACSSSKPAAAPPSTPVREAPVPVRVDGREAELPDIPPFEKGGVTFTAPDGTVTCSCVLVADTRDERAQGLMNRSDLEGYAGMVFVFEQDVVANFTMRDTPMPLSIGWYTSAGDVVSTADMDPCLAGGECPTHPAGGSYRFALEVPQGELPAVGAVDGATFALVEDCDEDLSR